MLLGIGSVFTLAWRGLGTDGRARFMYRWENGRCYRVRYVMHGSIATSRLETSSSNCPSVDRNNPPKGLEWLAVVDCHFVDCLPSSLTASMTKNKTDYVSMTGHGPTEQDACEHAKTDLREFLTRDHCTPTECICFKVERTALPTNDRVARPHDPLSGLSR